MTFSFVLPIHTLPSGGTFTPRATVNLISNFTDAEPDPKDYDALVQITSPNVHYENADQEVLLAAVETMLLHTRSMSRDGKAKNICVWTRDWESGIRKLLDAIEQMKGKNVQGRRSRLLLDPEGLRRRCCLFDFEGLRQSLLKSGEDLLVMEDASRRFDSPWKDNQALVPEKAKQSRRDSPTEHPATLAAPL